MVLNGEDALESPAVTRYDVVVTLPGKSLKVRRATEYAPLVITECSAAELPPTLAGLMLDINA